MSPRRRQRSSFGSVTKLDRDTWRLRWWADTPEGRRRVSETVHGTRREAEDRLAEIRCEVGSEQGGSVTVGVAYERLWLPDARGRVAPNTLAMYESSWGRHGRDRWAKVPMSEVRRKDVQDWLSTKTYAVASVAKTLLKQVGDAAVLYERADSNPFDFRVRLPKNESPADKTIYTLAQLLELADRAEGSHIEAAVLLAAFGSCRVGEAMAVRCDEVEAIEVDGVRFAAAKVGRQVDNKTGATTDLLKTRWSYRPALLPGRVGARLLAIAEERSTAGDPWLVGDGLGGTISQNALRRSWHRLDLGNLPRIDFRNLRNSWETAMKHEVGVAEHVIERMMGHGGGTVTMTYYDRPTVEQLAYGFAQAYKLRPFAGDWDI